MRPRLAQRIVFSLLPLIVVLGSAELGLRAAGWPPKPAHFDHNAPFWVTDPDLDHESFPHPEENSAFLVSTDHHGLRAPLHGEARTAGKVRVMTLGCSTTFGWGVEDDQSYPARLETLAAEAGHPEVEVINGGQPGYTSFQGLWLWDTTLSAYYPDVVLLGYVVQDARKSAYTDRSQAVLMDDQRYLKDHLLWKSRVYLGLRALIGSVQIRAKERPNGAAPDDANGVFRVPPDEYRENLTALVARARAVGAKPVLFGYPLEQEGYTAEHRAALRELAAGLNVPILDIQAPMAAAATTETLYFPEDRGHANAAGNDRIAHWVLDFLLAQHLVGA